MNTKRKKKKQVTLKTVSMNATKNHIKPTIRRNSNITNPDSLKNSTREN